MSGQSRRSPFKWIETLGKYALVLLLRMVLWQPVRRARGEDRLAAARRVLLVRIDDRLGEALLNTPVLATLAAAGTLEVHLLVHPNVERIFAQDDTVDALFTLDPKGGLGTMRGRIRELRQRDYDVVVDCGSWQQPSVTAAIVARLIGARCAVLGSNLFPVSGLRTHPIAPLPGVRSEIAQRVHLVSLLGGTPIHAMHAALRATGPESRSLVDRFEAEPHAVLNPGGRLGWRRVPPEVFVAVGRALLDSGTKVLVSWGPGEEDDARGVADAIPGAVLAPRTDLGDLTALFRAARGVVCNNTGPMHLAVATGTPTLQLFLHMETARWGHDVAPHRVLDLTGALGDLDAMCRQAVDAAVELVASAARRHE